MLKYPNVWQLVNQKYQELETEKIPYQTEEILPCEIEDEKIKAVVMVLVDEFNRELSRLSEVINNV